MMDMCGILGRTPHLQAGWHRGRTRSHIFHRRYPGPPVGVATSPDAVWCGTLGAATSPDVGWCRNLVGTIPSVNGLVSPTRRLPPLPLGAARHPVTLRASPCHLRTRPSTFHVHLMAFVHTPPAGHDGTWLCP